MSVYLDNIFFGVVTFPFLAALITLPYLVYQYRRFGSVPWLRTLIVYSFVFYLLCAYYLVILPLPPDRDALVAYAQTPQTTPFLFIGQIMAQTPFAPGDPGTWLPALKTPALYEALFNIALLMPLGAYLRYYFRRKWFQVLLIGFAVTLFFECSQITGLFGIYAHPYRLFDVDDLILNTFGAMAGFWAAGPALRSLPDVRLLNEEAREKGVRASLPRRALSLAFDCLAATAVAATAGLALFLIGTGPLLEAAGIQGPGLEALLFLPAFAVVFVIVPSLGKGRTLGQRMLKLAMVRADLTPARWYNCLGRYGLLFLFVLMPPWAIPLLFEMPSPLGNGSDLSGEAGRQVQDALFLVWGLAMAAWVISLLVRSVRCRKADAPFATLNGLLSNTRIMSLAGIERQRDYRAVLTVGQIRALEQMLADDGTPLAELMARAGHAAADVIRRRCPDPVSVVVAAGAGNNGGDGWVVAGDLARAGYPVCILTPCPAEQLAADPARTCALEVSARVAKEGLPLRPVVLPDLDRLSVELAGAEVVVDALLGTGFSSEEVRAPFDGWIEKINERHIRKPDPLVVALDVPSGYSAQTGADASPCIVADVTVVMLAYKPGLLMPDAPLHTGDLVLAKIADIAPYQDALDRPFPGKGAGVATAGLGKGRGRHAR